VNVSSTQGFAAGVPKPIATPPGRGEPSGEAELTTNDEATDATTGETAETGETDKLSGVTRNLLEGHFKGVADVRLRINFHDELLAAAPPANHDDAVQAGADGLFNSIGDEFGTFLAPTTDDTLAAQSSPEQVDSEQTEALQGALGEFSDKTGTALDAFVATGDLEALATSVQSDFSALTDFIAATLVVPQDTTEPTSQTEDETSAGETTDTEQTSGALLSDEAQAFLDGLEAALADFLTLLSELPELEPGPSLPPLSQPSGQGGAYDKFVALYYQLLSGSTEAESDSSETESFDVVG
jgi:hypothetical protein